MTYAVLVPAALLGNLEKDKDKIFNAFNKAVQRYNPEQALKGSLHFQSAIKDIDDQEYFSTSKCGSSIYIADFKTSAEAHNFFDYIGKQIPKLKERAGDEKMFDVVITSDEKIEAGKASGTFKEYNCDAV